MLESLRDRVREFREARQKAARLRRLSPAMRAAARETVARELGLVVARLGEVATCVDAYDTQGLLNAFFAIQQHMCTAEDALKAGLLENDVLVDACRTTNGTCLVVLNCVMMPGASGYRPNIGSDEELTATADVAAALEKLVLDSLNAESTLGTDDAERLRAFGSRGRADLTSAWQRLVMASFSAIDPIIDRYTERLRGHRFALAHSEAMRVNWKLSGLPSAMIHAGSLNQALLDEMLEATQMALQLSALAQRLNQTPEEAASYGPAINLAAVQADNLKETVSELMTATAS